jgi:tetratricopeptide (TPR) repeat protein
VGALMARARVLQLALVALLAGGAWLYAVKVIRDSTRVTFARDIAPIGFEHCAPCHRPGQAGPFSLLSYADYRKHARDIAGVVEDRYMPPWKPSARDGRFRGQRALSDQQIALIRQWVDDGMVEGDVDDLPALPKWSDDWQLGEPDVIVQLAAPYELGASGRDEYRNFVIPSPVQEPRYVVGWELRPNGRNIHHAILNIDRMGNARRADAADPAPGYSGMGSGIAQSPDGFYLVWAPGKAPAKADDGSAWRLDAETDLVLELHMQRTGKVERVNPSVALYFGELPPTQRRISLRIGDQPIDLAAGQTGFRITDSLRLPVDTRVLSMFPHAHYLGKTVKVDAALPDGRQVELLRIDDWDFNWQDAYAFAHPPILPAGTRLLLEISYDNSAANPRNPSHPPVRVQTGEQSTDEMGNVTFQVMPARADQLDALLEIKYRDQLKRGGGANVAYNLANTIARQPGRREEAVKLYQAVLVQKPDLEPALANLGGLLVELGRPSEALPHLEAALQLRPGDRVARVARGRALVALNRRSEGIAELERVLEEDPSNPLVRSLLDKEISR